jgi:methylglutaconyl-CoA hydratase
METIMSEELKISIDERGVMRIVLNRPEVHNAFDDHQIQRLIAALESAQNNSKVRVVILAGEGKSFSAGGDLNYMRRMAGNTYEENKQDAGQLARLMKTLNFLAKPTIARVHGAAFGGGVGLAACCDIAIGTAKTKFCLSEVKVGMVPATIAPYVARTIGEKAARRFFATAEMITADKALALGLLSELVDEDKLDSSIEEIVVALLSNAPEGVRKAKQIVFDTVNGDVTDAIIEHTVEFIAEIRNSDEGREGLSAFLEKRKPNWLHS